MALPSTLFRFRIDLADVDRGVYEPLDFRVAMHPSESTLFLVTRVLAFALNVQEGLEFTPGGLSDPNEPCLRVSDPRGGLKLWIEIGNPSAKKLHKAAKLSQTVRVYTYKDPQLLLKEMSEATIYHASEIGIFSIAPEFLKRLEAHLQRDNTWSLIHTDGALTVNVGERSEQGELKRHFLAG